MFNPNEHLMDLKGKQYLQVMWRLVWFREDKPNWCIDTKLESLTDNHAVFSAKIYDENGVQKSAGYGSESVKDFRDFIEKAETKAVGRALAMLGYGTQFTATELDEGERIVDSPVDRMPRGSAEAAQEAGNRKLKEIEHQMKQARDSDPASPVRSAATDEQIAFIRENADGKTL
jgi:hypothetical protein